MIKKIIKKTIKEVDEVIGEIVVCDVCNKEVPYAGNFAYELCRYYKIRTGHYDWGNDSCDSVEYRQVCSEECLLKAVNGWLKDKDNKKSDTAYIEINKEYIARKKEKKNDRRESDRTDEGRG